MSIDEALQQIAAGDSSALEEVYRRTRRTVYYIALSVLRERMLAEDVMQSTYLKVLSNAARYRKGTNACAWIARIAKNEAISIWRKRRQEVSVDEREEQALFGSVAADEYGMLIDLARRVLGRHEFAVLLLSAAEGYKRREIAQMLGMPLPTVTWHYGRAVEKMQKALRELESAQGGGGLDRKELERELRAEAEQHTPDVYDRIVRSQQELRKGDGEVLAAARPDRRKVVLACVLAAVILCLAVLLPFVLRGGAAGLSGTVYLSINPAVEFVIENDRVTGVRALNRDAALLVAGEEFTGLSPEEASEKFVALSETKHLITQEGIGVRGTGADGAELEQRVRDRLGENQSYSVHELGQSELDALIAAYDEQAMGDFEDYLERELVHLRDTFAETVHALLDEAAYTADLQALSPAEFNAKYLYLGEDCIYEDGDESPEELLENFRELKASVERYGDGYLFDELFDEFLEAVEELYEPDDDPSSPDDDDNDDDDDDDGDDDDGDDD